MKIPLRANLSSDILLTSSIYTCENNLAPFLTHVHSQHSMFFQRVACSII